MRKVRLSVLVLVALLATFGTALAINRNYSVHLSGDEEVPVRVTGAQGQAIFHVSKDGDALEYKLIVANNENVVAAHIHCGAAGVNGPVGVTLFMGTPGGGRVSGVLAERLVVAPDPGNACGWTNLDAVVNALNGGNTYVNVHTNDGVAPPNTGPGDFPGGEIRGQVR